MTRSSLSVTGRRGAAPPYRLGAYSSRHAPPHTRQVIEATWRYDGPSTSPPGAPPHRVIPHVATSVVVEVRGEGRGRDLRVRVFGPLPGTRIFHPDPSALLLGVRVGVEWTEAVAGRSATELTGQLVEPRDVDRWLEALRPEPGPDELHERLMREVLVRVAGAARPTFGAATAALDVLRFGRAPSGAVRAAAARADVSPRHCRRLLRTHAGTTPKTVHRIARLEAAITTADRAPSPAWSRIAVAFGFADQAHLIRECVEWIGVTPSRLHAERAGGRAPSGVAAMNARHPSGGGSIQAKNPPVA